MSDPSTTRCTPLPCADCGKIEVRLAAIAYTAEIKHDGKLYALPIPELHVQKCDACGEVFFDAVTDDQISQALRERLGLLSPQEIRERLNALALRQKEFAEQIRVAPETISRWLSGAQIQSRAMDQLMRMFFEREGRKSKSQAACGDALAARSGGALPPAPQSPLLNP
jgi:putative zinc finger/helix-turn-helix YgiT family protein